jgi:hypothetical protein
MRNGSMVSPAAETKAEFSRLQRAADRYAQEL